MTFAALLLPTLLAVVGGAFVIAGELRLQRPRRVPVRVRAQQDASQR